MERVHLRGVRESAVRLIATRKGGRSLVWHGVVRIAAATAITIGGCGGVVASTIHRHIAAAVSITGVAVIVATGVAIVVSIRVVVLVESLAVVWSSVGTARVI